RARLKLTPLSHAATGPGAPTAAPASSRCPWRQFLAVFPLAATALMAVDECVDLLLRHPIDEFCALLHSDVPGYAR
ncbi:MAG: hypothetical protein ACYTGK_18955, partial [Planctomycetota bacterium]